MTHEPLVLIHIGAGRRITEIALVDVLMTQGVLGVTRCPQDQDLYTVTHLPTGTQVTGRRGGVLLDQAFWYMQAFNRTCQEHSLDLDTLTFPIHCKNTREYGKLAQELAWEEVTD